MLLGIWWCFQERLPALAEGLLLASAPQACPWSRGSPGGTRPGIQASGRMETPLKDAQRCISPPCAHSESSLSCAHLYPVSGGSWKKPREGEKVKIIKLRGGVLQKTQGSVTFPLSPSFPPSLPASLLSSLLPSLPPSLPSFLPSCLPFFFLVKFNKHLLCARNY